MYAGANVPRTPLRLYALVFLSGASGLIYEVLWIRALGRHFGATVPAVATVVAAFMAGMALGGLWLGSVADRSSRPFRLYRRIELGIGLSALALSLLLLRGDAVLHALARWAEAAGAAAPFVRFVLFAALIVGPSTLIGGTLVVLSRALARDGRSGAALGGLYAVNTAGAVCGALAPDFALVPWLGLTAAAVIASAGNLLVALLARGLDEPSPRPSVAVSEPPPESEETTGRAALVLYAISGFTAMGVEVLWSRTLSYWVASLSASFAVLLAIFLLAIALGSWVTRSFADRVRQPLAWAAASVALIGPAVLVPLAYASAWRDLQRDAMPYPSGELRSSMWRESLNALAHGIYLEGAACLLMGATFPLLAAACVREGRSGRQVGALYAVNCLAGVLGSITVGFLWLPSLGELDAYLAVACVPMLGAAGVALRARRSPGAALAFATVPVTVALLAWLPGDALLRAHFKREVQIVAMREGSTTTAVAAQRYRFGVPSHMELVTPGVSMSDTSFGARRYMAMMGHLGMFFSPKPERALLVCYGVGNTALALLSHPDLKRLDVVDISEEVLSLSPQLNRERPIDPLRDPRTRAFVDDGRHHLVARDLRYDVITSEPPPPNHAGVVNLYSREYYHQARARLRPGGVLTQWLPVFQLSDDDAGAIVAAFVDEFPHTALFYGYGWQLVLVGSDQALVIDHARFTRRAALPRVAASLRYVGIDSVETLYGSLLATDAELRTFARGHRAVTDDRPSIQYPMTAVRRAAHIARSASAEPRALALLRGTLDAEARARLLQAARATETVLRLLPQRDLSPAHVWETKYGLELAAAAKPGTGREATLALVGADDESAQLAQRLLSAHPDPRAALAGGLRIGAAEHDALEAAVLTLTRRALYLKQ